MTAEATLTAHQPPGEGTGASPSQSHPIPLLSVSFEEIRYTVKARSSSGRIAARREEVELLHGVSGSLHPYDLTAIMGTSGAGKSTLLDILGRYNKAGRVEGRVRYHCLEQQRLRGQGDAGTPTGSRELHPRSSRLTSLVGLVEQHEVLLPYLTVREQLAYHARMLAASSRSVRYSSSGGADAAVQETIERLGLARCADVVIGTPGGKGVSGGQARRVSIGQALLGEARLLLLDEPTSGLDSFGALEVMCVLRALADGGMNVAATIHQPSAEIWALFDRVLLLVQGHVAYMGPAGEAPRAAIRGAPGVARLWEAGEALFPSLQRSSGGSCCSSGAADVDSHTGDSSAALIKCSVGGTNVAEWLTRLMATAERCGMLDELLGAFRGDGTHAASCRSSSSSSSSSSISTSGSSAAVSAATIEHECEDLRDAEEGCCAAFVAVAATTTTTNAAATGVEMAAAKTQEPQAAAHRKQCGNNNAANGANGDAGAVDAAMMDDDGGDSSNPFFAGGVLRSLPRRALLALRRQVLLLYYRALLPMRSPGWWAARFLTLVCVAAAGFVLFFRQGTSDDPQALYYSSGMLFLLAAVAPATSLMNLCAVMHHERPLLAKEAACALYTPPEFLAFRIVSESAALVPLAFALVGVAWGCLALRGSYALLALSFAAAMEQALLLVIAAASVAPSVRTAILPFNLLGLLSVLTAGFIIPAPLIKWWTLRWYTVVNFLRYSFVASMANFFGDAGEEGQRVLAMFGLAGEDAWANWCYQLLFFPVFLLLALAGTWYAAGRAARR